VPADETSVDAVHRPPTKGKDLSSLLLHHKQKQMQK